MVQTAEIPLANSSSSDLNDGADAHESETGAGKWKDQRRRRQVKLSLTDVLYQTLQWTLLKLQAAYIQPEKNLFSTRLRGKVSLKSGVTIIRKVVEHIDNLDPDCTPALLVDYMLAGHVSVLTCYTMFTRGCIITNETG